MNTTQNTVLITGGSAGIGLEIAKQFSGKDNHVIILGRNEERLKSASLNLKNVTAIVCDVSSNDDIKSLVERLEKDFPAINMVINNAGRALQYDIADSKDAFSMAQDEMLTNYLAIIRLNELLLPLLKRQSEAAIVNVSSVVAIVPGTLPTYSASKAALHSYTLSLRIALHRSSKVKVFELMPPLVDTEFSAIINGHNGIPPAQVATEFIEGFEKNIYEIHVGKTQYIYELSLKSPEEALKIMQP